MYKIFLIFAIICICFGCQYQNNYQVMTPQKITLPVSEHAMFPNLYSNGEQLFMTWIYEPDSVSYLQYSEWKDTQWDTPKTIAKGNDWFVNWADFPTINSRNTNHLISNYLPKNGAGTYSYNVALRQTNDKGKTWSAPIIPHRDSTATEHGFVSMFTMTPSKTGVVWLDGRNAAHSGDGHGHDQHGEADMTLRFASIDEQGTLADEILLDSRICSCCQTDAAVFDGGQIVVYRDRSEREVRDISFLTYKNNEWSDPQTLYQDNWKIPSCPVNGPAVAAMGEVIAVAWFTQADDDASVKLSFSIDGANSFQTPIEIDKGSPLGRVDVQMIDAEKAMITWLETTEDAADLMMKVIDTEGYTLQEERLTTYNPKRASGFPRMVRHQDAIYLAYTKISDAEKTPQLEMLRFVFFVF